MAEELFGEPVQSAELFGEPAQPSQGLFGIAPTADEEDKPSLISDVGRAVVTAPIEFGRGIAELAALGLDSSLDTDYVRDVSDAFDAADEFVGGPKTDAGQLTRDILVFGLGFLPVAGWLGKANQVAKTGQGLNATNKFSKSAEAFGKSSAGKALLGNRAKLLGTTAAAAGAYDFIISDGDRGGVADMIEFLPESMKTEADTGLTGRAEAARRFRNRLRRAFEAAALSATFDSVLYGLGKGSRALGETAVVGDALGAAARTTLRGWGELATLTGRIPGAAPVKENLVRYFSPQGGLERPLARAIQESESLGRLKKSEVAKLFSRYDALSRKAAKVSVKRAQRPDLMAQMEEDLKRYLDLPVGKHLETTYGKEFQDVAEELVTVTGQLQDNLFDVAETTAKQAATVRGVTGIPEFTGITRGAQQKKAKELLDYMQANKDQAKMHISRVYELYRNPAKLYKDLGGKNLLDSPMFKQAEEALVRKGGVNTPEARENARKVLLDMLNLNLGDRAMSPQNIERAIRNRLKEVRDDVVGESGNLIAKRSPVFKLDQGILQNRVDLTEIASVRALLGELTSPKERLGHMVDRLVDLNVSMQFYNQQARNAVPAGEAIRSISNEGRPPYVFLPNSGADLFPEERVADLSLALGKGASDEKLLEEADSFLRREGYRKLGDENFDDFAGGSYGRLSGMYVPEELYNTLTAPRQFGMNFLAQLGGMLTQMKGLSQKMLIVPNVASRVRDFVGGKLMKVASGNANSAFGQTDGQIAYNVVRNLFSTDPETKGRMTRILALSGVTDSSVVMGALDGISKGVPEYGATGMLKKGIELYEKKTPLLAPVMEFFEKTTAGIDAVAKAEVFFAEKSKLEEMLGAATRNVDQEQGVLNWLQRQGLIDRSKSEIENLPITTSVGSGAKLGQKALLTDVEVAAADLTRRVMPTYSEIGLAVREADRMLPFGNFVSFASENIRNMANILELGVKGLAARVDDELVQAIGQEAAERLVKMQRGYAAQRLTGLLTVATLAPKGLVRAGQGATGMTEEQMDRLHEQVDFFQKGQDIVPIEFDGEGKVKYLNLSYVAPYSFVTDSVQAALRGYQERGRLNQNEAEQILGGAFDFISALADPFASESLFYERVRDALPIGPGGIGIGRGGQTQTGAPIYESTDSLGSKMSQGFLHVVDSIVPAMAKLAVTADKGDVESGRLTRAMLDIPGRRGEEFNVPEELGRQITGFTPMTLDLKRDAEFAGRAYAPRRANTKTKANREILRGDATPESIAKAWGGYLDELYREQSRLYNEIQAFRELGLSDREIRRNLIKKAKLGTKEVGAIMRGEFYPGMVSGEIRKDVMDQMRSEDRRRLTPRVNWGALNRMSAERKREPLDPKLFQMTREDMLNAPKPNAPTPAGEEIVPPELFGNAAPPTAEVIPMPSAPAGGATPTAPAPVGAPGATVAAPSPELFGSNLMDQLRNMQLFERLRQDQ